MANEKLTTRLKNKTWTNPQIESHKKSHTQTDQTTDMTQKTRTHVFNFLTPSVEKTVNLHEFY
jgi:hypothetical protein